MFTLPKTRRLRKRREFLRMRRDGKRLKGRFLLIQYQFISQNRDSKLGITVSRKCGKSHDRNHFKRLVREIFRTHKIPDHLQINVIPRLPLCLNYHELKSEFETLIERIPQLTNV